MNRELERVEVPNEREARQRAWALVRAAFEAREPAELRARRLRPVAVLAVVLALLAAALSAPGRAVIAELREAVGIERAQPALFSLPAQGRLLVSSDAGTWVVQPDGSKRLLGDYREASWSPFGRFVVVAGENELAALEPDGDVRWTLARPGVRSPRWTGTETDTRIAYVDRTGLRVVAGDGTGDTEAGRAAADVAPAWRPGPRFTLAWMDELGRVSGPWTDDPGPARSQRFQAPVKLEWSDDGQRLLLLTRDRLALFGARASTALLVRRGRFADATFRPGSRELALVRTQGGTSELVVGDRVVFSGTGRFRDLTWSPDGRWLLFAWPTAVQWVFVRADGRRLRAVANVSEQFRSATPPQVEGWCCAG